MIQERFNLLFEEKGITAARFAQDIKSSPSAISHIISGRNKPGFEVLYNIAQVYPDIDLNWLITGKGSMYLAQKQEKVSSPEQPTLFDTSSFGSVSEPEVNAYQEDTPPAAPNPPLTPSSASSMDTTSAEVIEPPLADNTTEQEIEQIIFFFKDGSFKRYK